MRVFLAWIASFFSEESKATSSTRLIMIYGCLGPLTLMIALSIYRLEMIPIPEEWLWLVALFITGKVVQKPFEKRQAGTSTEVTKTVEVQQTERTAS